MPPRFSSGARLRSLRPPTFQQAGDAEVVLAAEQGDRAAQGELYERHAERVLALSLRLLGRSTEAEDVTQEAFLTAFRDLSQLRDKSQFLGWLLRIAVHLVHRRFRRRGLLERLGFVGSSDDCSLEALAQTADAEVLGTLGQIDRELRRLAPEHRVVWMLRHVEGYELKEVAEICDCSLATVKRRISKAQSRLDAFLAQQPGSAPEQRDEQA